MAEIFLSYASEDRARVKPLADALMAKGYRVWWDRALAAGDDYAKVIAEALAAAKAVVVVWTPASVASAWVRDEAARARDDGRLIPVLLDRVDIPLGFGAIQAEDFTMWNGGADAAQMQLLLLSVKARLEGREVDAAAVADRRQRLMKRVRLVTVLSVVAAVIGIAAGVSTIRRNHEAANAPPVAQQDLASQLLQLVADGRITPEQAIELAKILEDRTFEGTRAVSAGANESARTLDSAALPASVDDSEFSALARNVFRASAEALVGVSDPAIRQAVLDLSQPTKRAGALDTLAQMAAAGGPNAGDLWRIVGAVGLATGDPRASMALEQARRLNPDDFAVWRLLGYSYAGEQRPVEAEGAALVGAGLAAQDAQAPTQATQNLEQALPNLTDPIDRAFVQSELGDAAAEQGDLRGAANLYREGLLNPLDEIRGSEAAAGDIADRLRQRYAAALDGTGREREACMQLRVIVREGGELSEAPDDLLDRCGVPRPLRRESPNSDTATAAPAPSAASDQPPADPAAGAPSP
jgi:tetratricopeptide (TPR) repeat protein